jgi:hypothetical protein
MKGHGSVLAWLLMSSSLLWSVQSCLQLKLWVQRWHRRAAGR